MPSASPLQAVALPTVAATSQLHSIPIVWQYNPFQVSGTTLNVNGLNNTDQFKFTAGPSSDTVSFDGLTYSFVPGKITTVNMYGVGGGMATLTDQVNSATAKLSPNAATLTGPNYTVNTYRVFSNYVNGQAKDAASFYDGPGANTFSVSKDSADMYNNSGTYYNLATGFNYNDAYATHGGAQDTALFYDSAGVNYFEAGNGSAAMSAPGDAYVNNAQGFGQYKAYNVRGGTDTAMLFDDSNPASFGGILTASGSTATLDDPNASISVQGFQNVFAYASHGGYTSGDTATVGQTTYNLYMYGWWAINGNDPSYCDGR